MKILNRKQQDITTTRKIFKAKVALSLFPLLVTIFSLAINIAPTYADAVCEDSSIIYINESGDISYPSGEYQNAIDWRKNESTLTLHNYTGPAICSQYEEPINLVLDGENTIHDSSYGALHFSKDLMINGGGELIMETQNHTRGLSVSAGKIFIDGVKISQNTEENCAVIGTRGPNDIFIKDSKILAPGCTISTEKGGIILNDSDISVSGLYSESIFNQVGGRLDITGNSPEMGCLQAYYAIFNNATTNIDCTELEDREAIRLNHYYDQESFSEYLENEGYSYTSQEEGDIVRYHTTILDVSFDILFPRSQLLLFNNSDVTMKSNLPVITFMFSCDENLSCDIDSMSSATKDQLIKIGDGLITDPATIALEHFTNQDDKEAFIVYFFTDGTPGAYINFNEQTGQLETSDNVIKALHVYKSDSPEPLGPEPSPDPDPDIPNTLDSALFSIISTIIVSIIAEVFIIIDLRKRIYSTQDEIVNEELKTINSYIDSISSKPEKK